MSRVICAHCQASWEVDVAEMAPRETAVRCLRCGKDTTVDGLALLQEGASELELEWGDRVPRAPKADAPLVAAATALVARGDDLGYADLPEPSCREGQVGLEDVAAVTATLLLGLGIVVETWAAVEALFDAAIDVDANYLPDAARVALSIAAAVSFAAWSQLVLASRRPIRGAVDDPFFTLLLAPFRPARAQAVFTWLTELSGGPAALARQGESTFPWVLLLGFWGWLAWSLYVLTQVGPASCWSACSACSAPRPIPWRSAWCSA